jgi:hypothetical protein
MYKISTYNMAQRPNSEPKQEKSLEQGLGFWNLPLKHKCLCKTKKGRACADMDKGKGMGRACEDHDQVSGPTHQKKEPTIQCPNRQNFWSRV